MPIKRFIYRLSAFSLLFSIVTFLLAVIYFYVKGYTLKDIPAPNFSNSYSFNEKILFMREKGNKADILAIGSSMSLVNLNSERVVKEFKTEQFLNSSSWGMSMIDDYFFLKTISKIYKIKVLILVTNIIDFEQDEKVADYKFIESYLKPRPLLPYFFLKHFKLQYYLNNFEYAKKFRACVHYSACLKYDKYGTVNLKSDSIDINNKKLPIDSFKFAPKNNQYRYLDSISKFCRRSAIKLIVFQSPIQQSVFRKLKPAQKNILLSHVYRIEHLLKKDEQFFFNSFHKVWADSLFTDAIHLNETGAKLFTEFCLDNYPDCLKN